METRPDPSRRRIIQAVGCLAYIVGAAAVAGLAMMIWQIV